jgi:penicillin-binding protein 1C
VKKFLIASAAAVVIAAALLRVSAALQEFPEHLHSPVTASTEFIDRNGEPLRTMLVDERACRRRVTLEDISPNLIAATLAAEDRNFYSHPGFDPLALGRATVNGLRGAKPVSGASTITQQLVKEPGARSMGAKMLEILRAMRVEMAWSKAKILSEYLNRVDYGNLQFGIAAASRYYFSKPPGDLSAGEAAFLAALPKAPGRLDPHRNWEGAKERQEWILRRMLANGVLSENELRRAIEEPLALRPRRQDFAAPHFVDLLLQRKGMLPPHGGTVRTTLDLGLTRRVEQLLCAQVLRLDGHDAGSVAAVVLDNADGEVLALAGSGDYFAAGAGQVNGAWVTRSPGSAIKPFTYLLALERGANPGTVVADVPTTFSTPTGLYRPNNYNHRFHGPVSLRHALGNSLNVAAIRALGLAGGHAALHRLLRDLGISTLGHPPDYYGPGLTLGNGETRLLELANAYAAVARGGEYRPFRLLGGREAESRGGRRLFSAESAYLVSDMLADNRARAASFGLNSYLAFPYPVACKTGTSSDYRDNWAIGYTPEFTVAVWVGNPDGHPMRGITGVTGAAPVMHEIMDYLHGTRGTTWFAKPAGIREGWIEPLTGHATADQREGAVREMFVHAPPAEQPSDRDERGRVVLGEEYRKWLAGKQNGLGNLATEKQSKDESLRIISPAAGTVYYLDPDLPAEAQRIRLEVSSSVDAEWKSETLALEKEGGKSVAVLSEGRHELRVRAGGRIASTWLTVHSL